MGKRLNHGNPSFKLIDKECEPSGIGAMRKEVESVNDIRDLKKEIDECDLCQTLGKCQCHYHKGILQGFTYDDLFN